MMGSTILEQSGHLPHEEEAETFKTLVSEFVAEIDRTSSPKVPVGPVENP
ncbi:hypothetical protein BH23PLA1_BH23PLA1_13190 [soil metagenome]